MGGRRQGRRARARAAAVVVSYGCVVGVIVALLFAALMMMGQRSALPNPAVTVTEIPQRAPVDLARDFKDLRSLRAGDLVLYHAAPGDHGYPCTFVALRDQHLVEVECGQGQVVVAESALTSATLR